MRAFRLKNLFLFSLLLMVLLAACAAREVVSSVESSSSSEAVISEPTASVTVSTEVQRLAFREEIVTDIYAFETDTYTTVQCQSDFPDAEELLRLLEAMPERSESSSGSGSNVFSCNFPLIVVK